MLSALVGRSFGRARALLIALAVLLGGFQFLLVIIAAEVYRTQGFMQLMALIPSAVQQVGGGLIFSSFLGLASFGLFHPVIMLVFAEAAVFLGTEPAWEIEAGIVDLTLARPVPRALALTRTLIVICLTTSGLALFMVMCGRAALYLFAPPGTAWPPLRTAAAMAGNLMLVVWWFGGLAALTATLARRRSTALGIAGVTTVSLYLLHLVAEMWSRARLLRFITPYHYYNAPYLLAGRVNGWLLRDLAILFVATVLMWAAAYRAYERRDL
jgi:beta-exotoxin I transport system permease protein